MKNEKNINYDHLNEKKFTTKERKKLAKSGEALPDGSYPIRNRKDLINAIKSLGRGLRNADEKRKNEVLSHVYRRAKDLGVKLQKTEKGYWSIVKESFSSDTMLFYDSFLKLSKLVDIYSKFSLYELVSYKEELEEIISKLNENAEDETYRAILKQDIDIVDYLISKK